MKTSLILATIDRTHELRRFLSSLARQTYTNAELIVVDQNRDDRVSDLLAVSELPMEVLHVRSQPGLSRARNVGMRHASGDLIAFPDDDCWYAETQLEDVVRRFRAKPRLDGVTGRSIDDSGAESGGRFCRSAGAVGIDDVWSKGVSYTIFLRRAACEAIGGFDETLGVGARTRYGSGEETDYLIRALKLGLVIDYDPELKVFHPNKTKQIDRDVIVKAFRYGAGMGRVLAKHEYPLRFRVRSVVRPLVGSLLAAGTLDLPVSCLRLSTAGGRVSGMLR